MNRRNKIAVITLSGVIAGALMGFLPGWPWWFPRPPREGSKPGTTTGQVEHETGTRPHGSTGKDTVGSDG